MNDSNRPEASAAAVATTNDGARDARFRALIEAAPDGIVISREGKIAYMNPSAVQLLGYDSPDELVGMSMGIFLEPADLLAMRQRVETMRQTGARLAAREYRARRRDGGVVVAEITSLPIDFEGAPAVLGFARDVTERARLQEQLARADRLAALGTLAAGVAHEINNPLAFMALGISALDRLVRSSSMSDVARAEALALLADFDQGVTRVADIVRGLRAFSRADEEQRGPVDVAELTGSAARLLAHEIRNRATLVIDAHAAPLVLGNAARLEQVLVNVLLNSLQAFPQGAGNHAIEVRTSPAADGRVAIRISDNGPGVPQEILGRVFDPFFTTKPVGTGTGLGLSVCHRIMSQLGGEIGVESEVGVGTTVTLYLPAADPKAAAPAPPVAVEPTGHDRDTLPNVD